MATFKTSAIIELVDKTKTASRSIIGNFKQMDRAADSFGDEADKAADKGRKSFKQYAFEVRKAEDRLKDLRRDLREGKGDFNAIQREIDQTTFSLKKLNRENKGLSRGFAIGRGIRSGVGVGLRAGAGLLGLAGAGVSAGLAGANAFAKQADDALKLAESVGFAVESVTALQFALSQTVSEEAANALPAALRDLNKRAAEFSKLGTGEISALDDGLKKIIVSGKNTEDIFVKLGKEIRSRNLDSGDLAFTLEKIFGEPGTQLTGFFEKSQDDIDVLIRKAKEFGVVISEDTAREGQEFRDQIGQSQSILQGIGATFFSKLFGPGADLLENRINPALLEMKNFIAGLDAKDIEDGFDRLVTLIERFVEGLIKTVEVVGNIVDLVGGPDDEAVSLGRDARDESRNGVQNALNSAGRFLNPSFAAFDDRRVEGIGEEQLRLTREQNGFLSTLAGNSGINGADGGAQPANTISQESYSGNSIGYGPPLGADYTANGLASR